MNGLHSNPWQEAAGKEMGRHENSRRRERSKMPKVKERAKKMPVVCLEPF